MKYKIGDSFQIKYKDTEYTLTISGIWCQNFKEDIYVFYLEYPYNLEYIQEDLENGSTIYNRPGWWSYNHINRMINKYKEVLVYRSLPSSDLTDNLRLDDPSKPVYKGLDRGVV